MTQLKPSAADTERNIYLTLHRVIDAPVETVYAAWTEPEMLRHWLAPGNATVVRAVAEPEIGGRKRAASGEAEVKWMRMRGAFSTMRVQILSRRSLSEANSARASGAVWGMASHKCEHQPVERLAAAAP